MKSAYDVYMEADSAMNKLRGLPESLTLLKEGFGFDSKQLTESDLRNIKTRQEIIRGVIDLTINQIRDALKDFEAIDFHG